jgi:hypothetical protein
VRDAVKFGSGKIPEILKKWLDGVEFGIVVGRRCNYDEEVRWRGELRRA